MRMQLGYAHARKESKERDYQSKYLSIFVLGNDS